MGGKRRAKKLETSKVVELKRVVDTKFTEANPEEGCNPATLQNLLNLTIDRSGRRERTFLGDVTRPKHTTN